MSKITPPPALSEDQINSLWNWADEKADWHPCVDFAQAIQSAVNKQWHDMLAQQRDRERNFEEFGEGWESLAWELCAQEHGEEACSELIWEGGPIPEPWGDRWLKYEDEAKRLIALVHKHAAPVAQQSLAEAFRAELDRLSNRNYELRMENAELRAAPVAQQVPVAWPAGGAGLHIRLLHLGKAIAKERSREIGDAWNQLADLLALLAKAREAAPVAQQAVPVEHVTYDETMALARLAGLKFVPAQFSGVLECETADFEIHTLCNLVAGRHHFSTAAAPEAPAPQPLTFVSCRCFDGASKRLCKDKDRCSQVVAHGIGKGEA